MSSVGLPGELHVLLSLLLAHLPQHVRKLVKLLVPCIKHCETLLHDLHRSRWIDVELKNTAD